ncbi:hypothetical protein EJ06DRAFT_502146 [Trichodelitschia bisporula]|uniref:gamma-glutamylcyclotransferase n=1 Tax=Trichodelitschia bisporula TaxID=703511 RepID=A0A6G1IAR3_9PEZI|nr:hypothetical protein EJ06DRAFT_502146 [Trichodelitschia bisporula]
MQGLKGAADAQMAENRPLVAANRFDISKVLVLLKGRDRGVPRSPLDHPLPEPSTKRLEMSIQSKPFDINHGTLDAQIEHQHQPHTVLYLAYGSNLCYETFQKGRGVRPLSQINVLVPDLRLTFDIPGIPYAEPCFANTGLRDHDAEHKAEHPPRYRKDRWKKGLVGVVYEVTPEDYAHIIATEGGGSSYRDILVDCYPLPPGDSIPEKPSGQPFKAHTLFAPLPSDQQLMRLNLRGRLRRPDPSYAQPSPRYLKLIRDGADEHALPHEYRDYLDSLQAFRKTSASQGVGLVLLLLIWGPIMVVLFAMQRTFRDERGRSPKWLVKLFEALFANIWRTYDYIFKPIFGEGERTVVGEEIQG